MMAKSFLFRYSGKREEGKKIINDVINQLKPGQDYTSLGKAYYELSNYYDYDFKVNTINIRNGYLELAIAAFEKGGNIDDLGNAYKVMADLHHLVNEYGKALTEIEMSLKYYKQSNYKRLEGVYDMYVVERPTTRAAELSKQEFTDSNISFTQKIELYQPQHIAFLGKAAYGVLSGLKKISWGLQDKTLGGAIVWVLPNPSGLNRGFRLDMLVSAYKEMYIAVSAATGD